MKSDDTKRIIREIAEEEGISEWAVELIVKSQFEGAYEIIRSAVPDHPETFKGIKIYAFCHFMVMPGQFKIFQGHEKYLEIRERKRKERYGDKKQ